MSALTFQSHLYRGRTVNVSVERYGKGWLGEYSIDGGPIRRCDGRPQWNIEIAIAEAKRCAEMAIDASSQN